MSEHKYIRLVEVLDPEKPLGRHINHDPRSRQYPVAPMRDSLLKSVLWERQVPIFNQGNLGSCTGNAAVGAVATTPYKLSPNYKYNQEMAVQVYSEASAIDPFDGAYPPEDTGSDGLSVAKVLTRWGLASGYKWAFGLAAALTALQTGPVLTGITWYDSFDFPDSAGHVFLSLGAQPRGGHEVEVLGIDVEHQLVLCVNSWGEDWGDRGHFLMNWATWDRLLQEEGDVTVMVPPTEPAPEPIPTDDELQEMPGCMPFSKTIKRLQRRFG